MERRRLFALTLVARTPDGSTWVHWTQPNQQVTVQLWALVSDAKNQPSTDAVQSLAFYWTPGSLQLAPGFSPNPLLGHLGPETFVEASTPITSSNGGVIEDGQLAVLVGTSTLTLAGTPSSVQTVEAALPEVADIGPIGVMVERWQEDGQAMAFSYDAADPSTSDPPVTQSLTISPALPSPPVVADQMLTSTGHAAVVINALAGVALTTPTTFVAVRVTSLPVAGTETVQADGSILYTPSAAFSGLDKFDYTVTDVFGQTSAPAEITINVLPAAPVAPNYSAQTVGGQVVSIPFYQATTTETILSVTGGGISQVFGNMIQYLPDSDYVGPTTLTYTITDAFGQVSNVGTISINVGALITNQRSVWQVPPDNDDDYGGVVDITSFPSPAPYVSTPPDAQRSVYSADAFVGLSGPGEAEVFVNTGGDAQTYYRSHQLSVGGDLQSVVLLGTTDRTVATIYGPSLTGLTDASPLGSVVTPAVLSGDVSLSRINSLRVGGLQDAVISSDSLGSLRVQGNIFDSTIVTTNTSSVNVSARTVSGSTFSFAGALSDFSAAVVSNSMITAPDIGSVTVAALDNDTILAGGATGTLGSVSMIGNGTLGSVRLTGRGATVFTASTLLADKIGSASLSRLGPDDDDVPDGIAAASLGNLFFSLDGMPKHFSRAQLQKSLTFGDLQIQIV